MNADKKSVWSYFNFSGSFHTIIDDNKGNLMMDFDIKTHKNQIHVITAPSPAATSALSIADYIIKNYIK